MSNKKFDPNKSYKDLIKRLKGLKHILPRPLWPAHRPDDHGVAWHGALVLFGVLGACNALMLFVGKNFFPGIVQQAFDLSPLGLLPFIVGVIFAVVQPRHKLVEKHLGVALFIGAETFSFWCIWCFLMNGTAIDGLFAGMVSFGILWLGEAARLFSGIWRMFWSTVRSLWKKK